MMMWTSLDDGAPAEPLALLDVLAPLVDDPGLAAADGLPEAVRSASVHDRAGASRFTP